MPRGRSQGAGADHHRVGERTKQTHEKAVRRITPTDRRAGRGRVAQCYDPVQRCDEVRVDDAVRESQVPIDADELVGQLRTRYVRFVEDVERLDQCSNLERAVSRNSLRSCPSFS